MTSDGGAVLLRLPDRRSDLLRRIARSVGDTRQRAEVQHSLLSMLRQRVYGLALGYEDVNDHESLRRDPGYQTAVGRDTDLASSPTLCRLENRSDRATAWAMHRVPVKRFMDSPAPTPTATPSIRSSNASPLVDPVESLGLAVGEGGHCAC